MNVLQTILAALKLPLKIIAGLALFSGITLLLPPSLVNSFQLREFLGQFGMYIAIVFIASISFIIINLLWATAKRIRLSVELKRQNEKLNVMNQAIAARIQTRLNPHEKAVLREFYIQSKNTIQLAMDDSVVAGLINDGIIQMVGSFAQPTIYGLMAAFSLSVAAARAITPQSVDFPLGEPSQTEIDRIVQARPAFVRRLQRLHELF